MTRKLIHLAALSTLLFLAGNASATVVRPGDGPSKAAKAAIKKAVVKDAKAFLQTQPSKLRRPSYAVSNYRKIATGHLEFDATIRAEHILWFPGAPGGAVHRSRMPFFRATFLLDPTSQGQQVTLRPLQPWTPQPLPLASPRAPQP